MPPFTAYLDPSDSLRYLNYAIPDGDVVPTATAIDALREVFRLHDRLPRLEWVEEAAPRVAPALAAAGMEEELRTPLMACAPDGLREPAASVDSLTVAPVDDEDLRDLADLQRVAFGGEPLGEDERPRDIRIRGGGAVLARAAGQAVSVAAWTEVVDSASEIVGVATAEAWRGRGLAGVTTAAAAREAFAGGASVCILSPGDAGAERVYARAGFRAAATMLHWSDPD